MSKITKDFEFALPYNKGKVHFCDILIVGKAYAQYYGDTDSYDFDIESIHQINEDGTRSIDIRQAVAFITDWTCYDDMPDVIKDACVAKVAKLFDIYNLQWERGAYLDSEDRTLTYVMTAEDEHGNKYEGSGAYCCGELDEIRDIEYTNPINSHSHAA